MAEPQPPQPVVLPSPCGADLASVVCQLPTFTAFQIGSICALIVALILFALGQFPSDRSGPETSQFWLAFLITAVYYTISEWTLEEANFLCLRTLQWQSTVPTFLRIISFWIFPLKAARRFVPLATLEFLIRVLVVVLLASAVTAIPHPWRMGMTGVHIGYLVIITIYLLFLFWDLLLVEGGQEALARRFVIPDFIGLMLILGSFTTSVRFPALSQIIMGLWCVFLGMLLCHHKPLLARLKRQRLR